MSNSIIQDLIAEGVCPFYPDYRSGSYQNLITGFTVASVDGAPVMRRDGTGFNGADAFRITTPGATYNELSIFAIVTPMSYGPDTYNAIFGGSPTLYLDVAAGTTLGRVFSGGLSDTVITGTAIPLGQRSSVLFSYSAAAARKRYYNDGLLSTEQTSITGSIILSAACTVGCSSAGVYNRAWRGNIETVMLFTRELTETEVAQLTAEALEMYWPQKVFARNRGYVDINPAETGLVAGWNMKPVAGQIIDQSPNGNDGAIVGAKFKHSPLGPSLDFDGLVDYVDCGAGFQALTDVSVSLWFKVKSYTATAWLVDYYLSTDDRWGLAVTVSGAGLVSLYIYDDIDNAGTARYNQDVRIGVWHHACLQMSSLENLLYVNGALAGSGGVSSDNWASFLGLLYLGTRAPVGNYADCEIVAPKIHNTVRTPAQIAAEYQDGARAVLFKTDWGARETVANVASGFVSNTPFQVISGSFAVVTTTYNGKQVKAVKCTGAGLVSFPASIFQVGTVQASVGTWRVIIKKAIDGSNFRWMFIANQDTAGAAAGFDGYEYRFQANSIFALVEYTNGAATAIQVTDVGAYPAATWYDCRMARTNAGVISTYVDNTPIDLTGGAGTNPVLDATHFYSSRVVASMATDDMFILSNLHGDDAFIKYLGAVAFSTDGDFV